MLLDNLALTQAAWIQIFKSCDAAAVEGFLALAQVCPTLAITWPQVVKAEVFCLAEAAQVNGGVREWQECQVQQEVTTAQSPSP